ncbi:MAG: nitroreductase family protein [Bacteroidales bacterium]|nr:nitroreductase family protein [Bacteroidales bacterium]
MGLYDIVRRNRSYRRFYQNERINREELVSLVNLARLSASGQNKQALKFLIVNDPEACDRVFPSTMWAGYLEDWDGPQKGEQPAAYIIILGDTGLSNSFGVDHGIAAQSILLGAAEKGYGGCMIGSIKKAKLRHDLEIPGKYEILLILALGKPKEKVVIDEVTDDDIKYWRDDKDVHHVPKRSLDDLITDL